MQVNPGATSQPRYLVLATGNAGKVREFQSLLAPLGFALLTPGDVGFSGDIDETGSTFAENALIKARALAAHTVHPVLADDSGLEVDALDGAPGIRSARYAGADDTKALGLADVTPQDARNRAKLLHALRGRADRAARFRCVLCWLESGGEPRFFEGACEGEIIDRERGEGGFGYDPLFIPLGYNGTFGELPASVKDVLSHRGQAAAALVKALRG